MMKAKSLYEFFLIIIVEVLAIAWFKKMDFNHACLLMTISVGGFAAMMLFSTLILEFLFGEHWIQPIRSFSFLAVASVITAGILFFFKGTDAMIRICFFVFSWMALIMFFDYFFGSIKELRKVYKSCNPDGIFELYTAIGCAVLSTIMLILNWKDFILVTGFGIVISYFIVLPIFKFRDLNKEIFGK